MSLYRHTTTGEIRDMESIPAHKAHLWEPYTPPPPPPPTPEQARLAGIDAAIEADTLSKQLKSMTAAQFDAWWSDVTNSGKRDPLLKALVRLVIRRVL